MRNLSVYYYRHSTVQFCPIHPQKPYKSARICLRPTLLKGNTIGKNGMVLVMTGHGQKFREPDYYTTYPEISEGFAKKLMDRGVSIIGMDTPSPDRPPFAVHKILLGNNVLIIENLTNLEALLDIPHFEVIALPAKFHTDAAAVRVIAKVT